MYKKKLTKLNRTTSGRNNEGKITVRHKEGGAKNRTRLFCYTTNTKYFQVISQLKNTKSNNKLILVLENNKTIKLRIATQDLDYTKKTFCFNKNAISLGSDLFLKDIPLGSEIHAVRNSKSKSPVYLRSSGTYGKLLKKENGKVFVKLRSKFIKIFPENWIATFGRCGNPKYKLIDWKKAGISRHKGIRPTVRGVAMNPVDHPHGGGEGKTSGGRPSVSPWGWLTKGKRTTSKKRITKI